MTEVHKFRNALSYLVDFESYKIIKLGGFAWTGLNSFPHGACFLSSSLLGMYLIQQGADNVKLISANVDVDESPDIKSHAWLEVDGKYVDITSSQFANITNSRITVQNKHASEWLFAYAQLAKKHGTYREQEPDFDGNLDLYNLILSKINSI
ncbi:TPA: hypothetical protein ACGVBR_002654 [Vibrio vulnificus]